MFGMPRPGEIDYSARAGAGPRRRSRPSVAGPKRPQDRIELPELKERFRDLLQKPVAESGYGKTDEDVGKRFVVRTGVDRQSPTADRRWPAAASRTRRRCPRPPAPLTSEKNTNPETEIEMMQNRPTPDRVEEVPHGEFPQATVELGHGDVVIAAITAAPTRRTRA